MLLYFIGLISLFLKLTESQEIPTCCPIGIPISANGHCVNNQSSMLNCDAYVMIDEKVFDPHQVLDKQQLLDHTICKAEFENTTKIYLYCIDGIESNLFEQIKSRIVTTVSCISVLFLIITLIIYSTIRKLRDLQGICMIHAIIGLSCVYTFLGLIQLDYFQRYACTTMAIVTYYSFLYMFFWLSTLSFHIWRTVILTPSVDFKWWLSYHIFACGGSLLCLLFLLTAHYSNWSIFDYIKPNIGLSRCWFESIRESTIYIYIPMGILLLFNIAFYCHTIYVLFKVNENVKTRCIKYRLNLCIRLSIVMGLSWIFEIITAFMSNDNNPLYIKLLIFFLDSFNMLQGFIIFLVLVVFRKRVRRLMAFSKFLNLDYPEAWKHVSDAEIETVEENFNQLLITYRNKDNNSVI